jgi:molybdate transport system ATP-binding protein
VTVRLDAVDRSIGGGRRLQIDALEIPVGVTILFGPNGSGKTTLLKVLAGTLEGGPGAPVGYLPQRPHLFRGTARRTLLLGLDELGRERALQLAQALGVGDLLGRRSTALSGGERRRIALARALAGPEQIVALDEPFSEIGAADLDTVRAVVAGALAGKTVIVVTHDRADAAALGDRLVVMVDGQVRQIGTVDEVFAVPADEVVAAVLGTANLLAGSVCESTEGMVAIETAGGIVWGMGEAEVGSAAVALFGAESVTVFSGPDATQGSARNRWSGTVVALRPVGRLIEVDVDTGGGNRVVALLTPGSVDALGTAVGIQVTLTVKAAAVGVVRR